MPIYEYGCKKCGTKFEKVRSLAQRDDQIACPNCKSKTPKRIEVQRVATLTGARPNAAEGEGEAEDFLDGGDDFGDYGDFDDDF
ncbi:MAG: zinc ribbon domain-containing protein [Dehalococcoidia bacterium]|nr:zinc ribbon domain-containing protein [Dehalococcoidia bacterium]